MNLKILINKTPSYFKKKFFLLVFLSILLSFHRNIELRLNYSSF